MTDNELRVEDEPRPEDVARLGDRLYEFNAAASGVDNGRWLAIFVRDGTSEIQAGLHGWTWGRTGFVQTLWVSDSLRGRGVGARLLAAAEREAVRRGCHEIHLDTHDYQAPGFYRRQGCQVIGELPGWPGDSTRILFRKRLVVFRGPSARDAITRG
jgi:ribosomal protein S18 acetylase RimI-like enzyme